MESILVTGGSGYIGSHTCLKLLEEGYEIFVIDSFINSSIKSLEGVLDILKNKKIFVRKKLHIVQGDLRNKDDIKNIFEKALKLKKPISTVFHFAGLKSVAESVIKPFLYWETNVIGSYNLLKIMDEYECRNIIFSSSASIYKVIKQEKIKEEAEKNPVSPYGMTKMTVENLLSNIYQSSSQKWKIVNLRYFNPVGAHPTGLIGDNSIGVPNNIFPILNNVASGKIRILSIFGKDWPSKDGTCIRDYIHVIDLAEGHIKAFKFIKRRNKTIINMNLGTGKGTSVLELIKIFEEANNLTIPYKFTTRRKGDSFYLVADVEKSFCDLNWQPKRKLDSMCRDSWNFKLKFPDGF